MSKWLVRGDGGRPRGDGGRPVFCAYHFRDLTKMVNPKPCFARLVYSCTNRAFFYGITK